MKLIKNLSLFVVIVFAFMNLSNNSTIALASHLDFSTYRKNVNYTPANVVDSYESTERGFGFLENRLSTSPIDLITNDDGTFTVCVNPENEEDKKYVYIHEFDKNKLCYKSLKIEKMLPKFGSFIKDNDYYYIFFGSDIEAKSDKITKNMALVKYNLEGEKIAECFFNEPLNVGIGIKKPLLYGCKMSISNDHLLIYFGCEIYEGKNKKSDEASYAAMFDLETFTNITKNTGVGNLFASDSYDRVILPETDGFTIVDRVASYPRGFKLSKLSCGTLKSIDIFDFKGKQEDNNTFSQLGGIVKTSDGYLVTGTYENNAENSTKFHSASRNVFVQKVSEDLSFKGDPIYITNYLEKAFENAANVKIVQTQPNKNILLWELKEEGGKYNGTYMTIVNDDGFIQESIKELKNCRLNIYDDLTYNEKSNKVYWAINQENSIIIYELSLNTEEVSNDLKLNKHNIVLQIGSLNLLYPMLNEEDLSNKSITYKSGDESVAMVNSSGEIRGLKTGKTDILVTVGDNKKIVTGRCAVTVNMSNIDFERRVIELCNIERENRGIPLLEEEDALMNLARIKAQDMIDENYFSHTSPKYGNNFSMLNSFKINYMAAAENIAEGQITPEEVVGCWMGSEIHRENILNNLFTKVGVGTAMDENGVIIWTQEFIKPKLN